MAERGLFASTFDEFAFIRGILKMQMTEQSPVSEHGAFRHGLHRDEYGEGIGGTGIASVEHISRVCLPAPCRAHDRADIHVL